MRKPLSIPARSLLTICLFYCCTSFASADEVDALFIQANEYYQQSDFDAAINEYSKIIDLGYESWEVYYNLGNAYYKNRQIGPAILNYERARKLEPKNEDILFNLELANLRVTDRIPELPAVFFVSLPRAIVDSFGLSVLSVVTLGIYVVLTLLLTISILRKKGAFRINVPLAVSMAVILLFTTSLLLFGIYERETTTEAIVLVPRVDVRSAPNTNSTEMFTLHEGVKVQVKDESGEWLKIRLADGKVGWLLGSTLAQI